MFFAISQLTWWFKADYCQNPEYFMWDWKQSLKMIRLGREWQTKRFKSWWSGGGGGWGGEYGIHTCFVSLHLFPSLSADSRDGCPTVAGRSVRRSRSPALPPARYNPSCKNNSRPCLSRSCHSPESKPAPAAAAPAPASMTDRPS